MKQKPVEGERFYYDEYGLLVMTEKYHLDRGFCCGNGCRHCPYSYLLVAEPKRSQLLKKREIDEQLKGSHSQDP